MALQQLVQGLRLGHRARKAVQQEPARATQAAQAFAHHIKHRLIRHEVAAAHEVQGAVHGRGQILLAAAFGGAKDIARGKMTGAEALADQVGLRAFAHAGRAQQDDAPGLAGRRMRRHDTTEITAFEPGGAVMFRVGGGGANGEALLIHVRIISWIVNHPSTPGHFGKTSAVFAKKSLLERRRRVPGW